MSDKIGRYKHSMLKLLMGLTVLKVEPVHVGVHTATD